MSETATTPATPAAPAPEASQQETFSADYVKTLRDEAAAARVAKKEAVDNAKAEVIREYEGKAAEKDTTIAGLQTELSTAKVELLKLKAVLAEDVPSDKVLDVVALVQGTDEESVSESVKRVKSLMGDTQAPASPRYVDPSQGSGNNHIPLNGDPIVNMLKSAVGAR